MAGTVIPNVGIRILKNGCSSFLMELSDGIVFFWLTEEITLAVALLFLRGEEKHGGKRKKENRAKESREKIGRAHV